MSGAIFNWAVLGPGGIARKFSTALSGIPGARLYAVGSRDIQRARLFATEFGAEKAYGSYEELVSDASVDAVYIATPHTQHCEQALLAIAHGKHVLCEKPLSINAKLERRMADAARDKGVFLMEAMWSRFHPAMRHVCKLLDSGRIGEPRMLTADFSFSFPPNPSHRLYSPDLAGGGLLDVGIYVMSLSSMVFGPHPEKVAAFSRMGETHVDENAALMLQYPGGRMSSLTCGVRACGTGEAQIMGTEGRITLSPFWKAESVKVTDRDGNTEETSFPFSSNGFEYEIIEAMECIRGNKTQSAIMPLNESIAIMESMDGMRREWGLEYPAERES